MADVTVKAGGLGKKLAAVMAAVKAVPKRGHNKFHDYDYATDADILAAIRDELSQRNIVLLPAILSWSREPVGEKFEVVTHLNMEFTFLDGDTGERETRPWLGAGADKSDKGAYKAMTGGEKYFLLKTFLIPTGDDPEQDSTPGQPAAARGNGKAAAPAQPPVKVAPGVTLQQTTVATISADQRTRLFTIAKGKGWTKDGIAAFLTRMAGVGSTKDLPTHAYKQVIAWLELGPAKANALPAPKREA